MRGSDANDGTTILRHGDRTWTSYEVGVRFAFDHLSLARATGLEKLGASLYRVPPGRVVTPFHLHHVNEELAWVVDGTPSVRLASGERELAPGHVVAFPPGPDSAHQFLNRSAAPAEVLVVSTMLHGEVADYPDTGRRLHMRSPDGLSGLDAVIEEGRVIPVESVEDHWGAEAVDEPLESTPESAAGDDARIVDSADLAWEPYERGPFRAGRKRPGRAAGAERLGCSIYRIAPGDRMWPYHLHHVNEEAFVVVSGAGTVRTHEGEQPIEPGDAIGCPAGRGGAHAIRATGDEPLVVLALSTMEEPEVIEYPDSEKINVMVGAAPGGEKGARVIDRVFRIDDAVDYLEGER